MRLLADENIARQVIDRLRADGHIVEWIEDMAKGEGDLPILDMAVRRHLPLLTNDLDFGRYIFRDGRRAPQEGIILHRLAYLLPDRQADILSGVFGRLTAPDIANHFVTVDEHGIRFRPLP